MSDVITNRPPYFRYLLSGEVGQKSAWPHYDARRDRGYVPATAGTSATRKLARAAATGRRKRPIDRET